MSLLLAIVPWLQPAWAADDTGSAQGSAGMYSIYKAPKANTLFDHAFDAAPEQDLSKLLRQLLAVADRLSRYRIPKDVPPVYRLPHAELERYVCSTHCSIKAWYKTGDGIYLDNVLVPEVSVFDRSILLHELVHFLQERAGEYENMDDCNRWFHREVDAYNIQNRYLGIMGHPSRVAFTGDNCAVRKAEPGTNPVQVFDGKRRHTDPEH